MKSLFSSFKLLVTLDFKDSPLDHLLEAIGDLLNLKYLNVRNTKMKTIPKFIPKYSELLELVLFKSYDGGDAISRGMVYKTEDFKTAKPAWIEDFKDRDERTVPHLEALDLGPFTQMEQAPADIQNLISIKHLLLNQMPYQIQENTVLHVYDSLGNFRSFL